MIAFDRKQRGIWRVTDVGRLFMETMGFQFT